MRGRAAGQPGVAISRENSDRDVFCRAVVDDPLSPVITSPARYERRSARDLPAILAERPRHACQ
ncbi:hypothetical protein [Trebonia kvetii]|uniref:hypothetical protein n=1 Tax=Trebonia kvetii TaxID=2480626 RepID=UPI001C9E8D00|nr:hypothetical protein [Trebonia kvetii]